MSPYWTRPSLRPDEGLNISDSPPDPRRFREVQFCDEFDGPIQRFMRPTIFRSNIHPTPSTEQLREAAL